MTSSDVVEYEEPMATRRGDVTWVKLGWVPVIGHSWLGIVIELWLCQITGHTFFQLSTTCNIVVNNLKVGNGNTSFMVLFEVVDTQKLKKKVKKKKQSGFRKLMCNE